MPRAYGVARSATLTAMAHHGGGGRPEHLVGVDPAACLAQARAVDQLRVLPAQGRRGRGRAVAGDPAAGAGAPGLRLGHLRRRWHDPGPHRAGHRADRRRDLADPARAPHLRRGVGAAGAPGRGAYAASGVRNILALRGDPPGNVRGQWAPHPEGLDHADQLVALIRPLGDFTIGVAAFPDVHPDSPGPRPRRRGAGAQGGCRGELRDHPDGLRRRQLPAAARPGRRAPRPADHARA